MPKSKRPFIVIAVLVLLIIIIIIGRNYVFEVAITSGSSMEPTIEHGDHILVNRLAYRSQKPGKGDIIALKIGWVMMVKRVLGVPGDIIELKDNLLYCNSKLIKYEQHSNLPIKRLKQRSFGPLTVWDKHVFVIGDNEEHSVDSRNYGVISYNDIVGKVVLIYFPPGRIRKL
jgi:signal peptidase I